MRFQLALLGPLALLVTTGCGHMRLQGGDVDVVEEWPLAQRIDVGILPDGGLTFSSSALKPSALVRISLDKVEDALALGLEPALSLKYYGAPFHSGLFSTVTYQYGTDRYGMQTDYTLDLEVVQGEREFGWYSYVGAVTLTALPTVVHETWSVRCVLRDRDHTSLAEYERSDSITDVLWLPLLPFNVLLNLTNLGGIGTTSGLNAEGVNAKLKVVQERMVRSIMLEVRDQILKAEGAPAEPPKPETPETPEAPKPEERSEPQGAESSDGSN